MTVFYFISTAGTKNSADFLPAVYIIIINVFGKFKTS